MSTEVTHPNIPKELTLSQFWPYYVLAHQKTGTQLLHLIGTLSASALLITSVVLLDWRLFLAGFVVGYGFAWTGHFLVEGNKPATFGHPFMSFTSDYRMVGCILSGRMKTEVERARQKLQS